MYDFFSSLSSFEKFKLMDNFSSLLQANQTLVEEIREINQQLIDTVVEIAKEDSDSSTLAAEGSDGMVVKCSYRAIAVSTSLKSHLTFYQMVRE